MTIYTTDIFVYINYILLLFKGNKNRRGAWRSCLCWVWQLWQQTLPGVPGYFKPPRSGLAIPPPGGLLGFVFSQRCWYPSATGPILVARCCGILSVCVRLVGLTNTPKKGVGQDESKNMAQLIELAVWIQLGMRDKLVPGDSDQLLGCLASSHPWLKDIYLY